MSSAPELTAPARSGPRPGRRASARPHRAVTSLPAGPAAVGAVRSPPAAVAPPTAGPPRGHPPSKRRRRGSARALRQDRQVHQPGRLAVLLAAAADPDRQQAQTAQQPDQQGKSRATSGRWLRSTTTGALRKNSGLLDLGLQEARQLAEVRVEQAQGRQGEGGGPEFESGLLRLALWCGHAHAARRRLAMGRGPTADRPGRPDRRGSGIASSTTRRRTAPGGETGAANGRYSDGPDGDHQDPWGRAGLRPGLPARTRGGGTPPIAVPDRRVGVHGVAGTKLSPVASMPVLTRSPPHLPCRVQALRRVGHGGRDGRRSAPRRDGSDSAATSGSTTHRNSPQYRTRFSRPQHRRQA